MNPVQALADGLRTALGVPAAAYALVAIGLNLQFGYAGLINVGQVGFMLLGAYGTAISVDAGASLPVGFAVGLVAASAFGLVLGLTAIRLRAEYLAIVTLAAAEILRLLVRAQPLEGLTGGVFGIREFANDFFAWNPIPVGRYGIGDVAFSQRTLWIAVVGWALVGLCALAVWLLVRSPWGRVVRAIHDDEDLARSLGKHVFAAKLQSLVIGGVIGALGGIVLSVDAQFVEPDFWILAVTTYAFTAMVLGGSGTVVGPVLGSAIFWFVLGASDTLLRQGLEHSFFSSLSPNDAGPIRFAAVGLVLVLLLVWRPQGLVGRRDQMVTGEY